MSFQKYLILFGCLSLSACSMFSAGLDNSNQFSGRVAGVRPENPIPVEIAEEIDLILKNRGVETSQNLDLDQMKFEIRDEILSSLGLGNRQIEMRAGKNGEAPVIVVLQDKNALQDLEVDLDLKEPASEVIAPQGELGKKGLSRKKQVLKPKQRRLANLKGPLGKKKTTAIAFHTKIGRGGKVLTYVVVRGDTLMKIAFEKHGDYLKWRKIYKENKEKISHPKLMQIGTKLAISDYKAPKIRKVGQSYRIKRGDSLKSISKKVYGSEKHWRKLWVNNPQLIKNPKRLFAGFDMYYEPLDTSLDRVPAKAESKSENN